MTIRTKLVGAFLLVALLVPVLGGIAVSRVRSINGDVKTLSDEAIPQVVAAKDLDQIQQQQRLAVLQYVGSGKAEDRQQFADLSASFDAKLAELTAASGGSGTSAELATKVADERVKFDAAAGQLIASRGTVDRNLAELQTKSAEIEQELISIRRRFVPTGSAQGDGANIPRALRYQVNDLLLGTEGMLRVVNQELALATRYTVAPDEAVRQEFEGAGANFNSWLQVAHAAGGPEDRAILDRVQNKFFKEFEPGGRSMMLAADFSAQSRTVFAEASQGISSLLGQVVTQESNTLARARRDAEATAGSTGRLMVVITLIAFLAAGMLGLWFAGSITRPLRHLRDVADRVSTGDLDHVDIDVQGKDEVADLADAFRRTIVSVRFLMGEGEAAGAEAELARSSA